MKSKTCKSERVKSYFHNFALLHYFFIGKLKRKMQHLSMCLCECYINMFYLQIITLRYDFIPTNGVIVWIQCVHICLAWMKRQFCVIFTHKKIINKMCNIVHTVHTIYKWNNSFQMKLWGKLCSGFLLCTALNQTTAKINTHTQHEFVSPTEKSYLFVNYVVLRFMKVGSQLLVYCF